MQASKGVGVNPGAVVPSADTVSVIVVEASTPGAEGSVTVGASTGAELSAPSISGVLIGVGGLNGVAKMSGVGLASTMTVSGRFGAIFLLT